MVSVNKKKKAKNSYLYKTNKTTNKLKINIMKYIRVFETVAAFQAVQATLDRPNVSLIDATMDVNYLPYVAPDYNGYDYVDLGLPSGTKWATMNIGANSISDYGNYYMYGKGTSQYNSSDSIYNGDENPLIANADTVTQVMGGSWHMPTSNQCQELINNTTYTWETINNIYGGKFTAQNGNYIFIPAAGYYNNNGNLRDAGHLGYIWSSTPLNNDGAYFLYFSDHHDEVSDTDRWNGYSIRGVVG